LNDYNTFPIALILNVYVDKVQYRKQTSEDFTIGMSFGEEQKLGNQFFRFSDLALEN